MNDTVKKVLEEEEENKKIEAEIEDIRQTLSSMEDTDFHYMDEQLRDLRHRVIYVHTVIEEYMGVRIGQILLRTPSQIEAEVVDKQVFHMKLANLLNEMDFVKKVKILQKFHSLPKELVSKFMEVNQTRVYFSHPSSYLKEIREYRNRKKYLQTLQLLKKTVDEINDLIRKENPDLYKPKEKGK